MICTCPRGCMWPVANRADAAELNLCITCYESLTCLCYESLTCLHQRHGDNWRSVAQLLTAENERLHAELDTLKLAHSGCVRTYWPDWSAVTPTASSTVTVTYAPKHPLCYVTPNGIRQTFTLGHLATDGNDV